MKIKVTILATILIILTSCKEEETKADAYGNFEATETTISAESNGKLISFTIEEGQTIKKGALIGVIDTIQLHLKKEQLKASKTVVYSKSKSVLSQVNVLKTQKESAQRNKKRIENLIRENAGTQKQLDDVNDKIAIIDQQIITAKTQSKPVLSGVNPINIQIQQLNDQIAKSKIVNPVDGTVLTKYAEPNELTSFGKPLYKIADLQTMLFKGYISEKQLSNISIGDTVTIKIDGINGDKNYNGTVSWIASEAEFTPKIIQTKEERVNLVYAIKISVKNDKSIKIGMPAEMWIKKTIDE
jgi:HlyD family secretion protein